MVRRVLHLIFNLCAISLTLISLPAIGAVSAQLSAQNIDELETVRLLIKVTETRQTQPLDLAELEKDFHVLNTNTVSQSRYLNGRGQTWVDYQITLQPKRTGNITIPSITIGQEKTPTLELKVRPLSVQTRNTIDQMVFFETQLSNDTVYVQSQLILTRRLLYTQGVQLYSDLPGAPELDDAVVLTLGETVSGTTQRNGKTYGVVQQRYAIFPETSGSFTIPKISVTASVRLIENDRASRKGIRVGTEALSVNVLPVPPEYPDNEPWLPAEKVTLFNVLSPERGSHSVGDTLTHELLIHIEGNIGTMAPPVGLELNTDQFRIYPQAPAIDDDTVGDQIKGSRLQTHSIVPVQPGDLTIPPVALTWWDTVEKKVKVSRTQDLPLKVTGTAIGGSTQVTDTANRPNDVDAENADPNALQPQTETNTRLTSIAWIAGLLIAVGLLFSIWRMRHQFRHWLQPQTHQAKMDKQIRKQLRQAFLSKDAAAVHRLLGDYLARHYQQPRHAAWQSFTSTSTATAEASRILESHLFASTTIDKTELNNSLQTLERAMNELTTRQPQQANTSLLPELYPA